MTNEEVITLRRALQSWDLQLVEQWVQNPTLQFWLDLTAPNGPIRMLGERGADFLGPRISLGEWPSLIHVGVQIGESETPLLEILKSPPCFYTGGNPAYYEGFVIWSAPADVTQEGEILPGHLLLTYHWSESNCSASIFVLSEFPPIGELSQLDFVNVKMRWIPKMWGIPKSGVRILPLSLEAYVVADLLLRAVEAWENFFNSVSESDTLYVYPGAWRLGEDTYSFPPTWLEGGESSIKKGSLAPIIGGDNVKFIRFIRQCERAQRDWEAWGIGSVDM